jgi:uncharacterized membrane protein
MGATEIVAIVGAASTTVVGIAGYLFHDKRSRDERAHEERLRRNERLWSARRETYLGVLRQFLVEVQIVDRTGTSSERKAPAMPPEDEWRDLRAQVDAYATQEVSDAVEEFDARVREFHEVPAGNAEGRKAAREEVRAAYGRVRTLVRDELEKL